jgi:hypothetical protein
VTQFCLWFRVGEIVKRRKQAYITTEADDKIVSATEIVLQSCMRFFLYAK